MRKIRIPVCAAIVGLIFTITMSPQELVVTKTGLKVGQPAPDFALLSDKWETVKLSDFRRKQNVVLVFYVLAFSPN